MCFMKSAKLPKVKEDKVEIKHADASLTKNSLKPVQSGYRENIKTSAMGLSDEAMTNKKTLLGE